MPKPSKYASGRWAVQYGAKLSGVGKPKMVYYDTKGDAAKDIFRRQKERKEHGVALVTSFDRQWIAFLKEQVRDLKLLPEIVEHWRRTGSGQAYTLNGRSGGIQALPASSGRFAANEV